MLIQRSFANEPYFFLADWGPTGKTDKEDGDDFSKQERLEKLASFQFMMIKHAMMCKCHGPHSVHFPSRKMSSRVSPVFFTRVTCSPSVVRSSVSATSAGVTFPRDVSACNPAPRSLPVAFLKPGSSPLPLLRALASNLQKPPHESHLYASVRKHSRLPMLIRCVYCSPFCEKNRLLNM
jgi:hypothetical protein